MLLVVCGNPRPYWLKIDVIFTNYVGGVFPFLAIPHQRYACISRKATGSDSLTGSGPDVARS